MNQTRSDDAVIAYDVAGSGAPVVLLHPFPAHHHFWTPILPVLSSRYQLILPDLRGHGESEIGEGPVLMERHARDLVRVLEAVGVAKAAFVGVSIGGYILFEFWRRYRDRVLALALLDTKPQADTAEARANRLRVASEVLEQGTGPFIESMLPKLIGRTTLSNRPDLVDGARRMMQAMSPLDISLVQRGMAERPDSIPDLKTINVATLIGIGEEDVMSTSADGELMRQNIPHSQLKMIPKAGHYAPWEQPQVVGPMLRQFLDTAIGGR